jgi:hypothetical protein
VGSCLLMLLEVASRYMVNVVIDNNRQTAKFTIAISQYATRAWHANNKFYTKLSIIFNCWYLTKLGFHDYSTKIDNMSNFVLLYLFYCVLKPEKLNKNMRCRNTTKIVTYLLFQSYQTYFIEVLLRKEQLNGCHLWGRNCLPFRSTCVHHEFVFLDL